MISAENFRASSSAKANALLESSEKSVAAIIFVNVGTLRTIRRVRIGCKRGKPSQKRPRRLFPLLLLVRWAVEHGMRAAGPTAQQASLQALCLKELVVPFDRLAQGDTQARLRIDIEDVHIEQGEAFRFARLFERVNDLLDWMTVVVFGADNRKRARRDSIDHVGCAELERLFDGLQQDIGRPGCERHLSGPADRFLGLCDHTFEEGAIAEGVQGADGDARALAGVVAALTVLLDPVEQLPPLALRAQPAHPTVMVHDRHLGHHRFDTGIDGSRVNHRAARVAGSPDTNAIPVHTVRSLEKTYSVAKILDLVQRKELATGLALAVSKAPIVNGENHVSCPREVLALIDQ